MRRGRRARRQRRTANRPRRARVKSDLGRQLMQLAAGGITPSMAVSITGHTLTQVKSELTRLANRGLLVRSGLLYLLTEEGRRALERGGPPLEAPSSSEEASEAPGAEGEA